MECGRAGRVARPLFVWHSDFMSIPQARRRRGSGTALLALRRLRHTNIATAVVVGVQVPALLTSAILVPHGLGLLALPVAVALSHALLSAAASPYSLQPRSRAHLYLGIWPSLVFWAACLAFIAFGPLALVMGWLLRLPASVSLGTSGLLCLALGLRAVWRTPAVHRVTLHFPQLPPALDGYRISQISDIHCSAFAPEERVRDWVRRVNALQADLIAVTGDLIGSGPSHIPAVARALAGLRAPDGAFAVMGNHDYFGAGEELARALKDARLRLLRNAAAEVRRGDATLLVVGVDDTWTGRSDLAGALGRRPAGAFAVLLAHDPDLFEQAASLEVPLTLSGHTHGGQLAVPFLSRRLNLARLVTRYTAGLYRKGRSFLYVNRGAGTTGPPIRIGARAEISLFTLRRGA